jgi:cytochrome c2
MLVLAVTLVAYVTESQSIAEVPTLTPFVIPEEDKVAYGELLFQMSCSACHTIEEDLDMVGPSLMYIEDVAGTRILGYTAEEYLYESIVDPEAYIVDGFPENIEPQDFATRFTEEEIDALIAYLLVPSSGDPINGEQLFMMMGCSACHDTDKGIQLVGPSLMNIEDVAGTRIEGYTAEEYLYESIVNPNAYIVEYFQAGIEPQTFGDMLTDQQIYDIIAYLLAP